MFLMLHGQQLGMHRKGFLGNVREWLLGTESGVCTTFLMSMNLQTLITRPTLKLWSAHQTMVPCLSIEMQAPVGGALFEVSQ